jgi:hypothetical protein
MVTQETSRRRAVVLVVFGVIVVGLGAMLIIGLVQGDDTEHIDPQNGQVIVLSPDATR